MRKPTWGLVVKKRVRRFLEAMLTSADEFHWQDEDHNRPKLVVTTKRYILEKLTGLTQYQVYEAIESLKTLEILEDRRPKYQGVQDWYFALRLWSKDMHKNLKQFDREWDNKRSENSSTQRSTLTEPESNLADTWREVCSSRLEAEKQRRTNEHTNPTLNLYVPLSLIEYQQQPRRGGDVSPEHFSRLYESTESEITQTFGYEEFIEQVLLQGQSRKSQGKRLAIIGEPGAGKTTKLQKIADWLLTETDNFPIWVSLGAIGRKSLREYLLSDWLRDAAKQLEVAPQEWKDSLSSLLKSGKVWLLLDGIDEMAAENPMLAIAQQLTEGWADNVRVVLICRLNIWDANKNALSNFDVYRNLDFNPEQVSQLIGNWFKNSNPEVGQRLWEALHQPGLERIKDLVKNPLLLTQLCRIWQSGSGKFPNTKAELYDQFVQGLYNWKQKRLTKNDQRFKLTRALGQLALDAIDQPEAQFLLRDNFIHKVLSQFDPKLFQLALDLGWLNRVGVMAKEPLKEVYAFFHPAFEEYFAAQAIDDWRFFLNLGCSENSQHPSSDRIFQPQWKEIVLLWLGREEVASEQKEAFIKMLVDFEDNSSNQRYSTYFLAAAGIAEFSDCTQTDKIVAQLVTWTFGYFDKQRHDWKRFDYRLANEAAVALQESSRNPAIKEKVITSLIQLLRHPNSNECIRKREAEYLSLIGYEHLDLIQALTHLLYKTDEENRCWAAYSLGKIAPENSDAVQALTCLIDEAEFEKTRCWAARNLGEITSVNLAAIEALIELLHTTKDEEVCYLAARGLEKIAVGNLEAINALTKFLHTTQAEKVLCWAAYSLGKINPGNLEAINCLIQKLFREQVRCLAVFCLENISQGSSAARDALIAFLHNENQFVNQQTEYEVRWAITEILGKIDPNNPTAIITLINLIAETNILLNEDNIEDLSWRLRSLKKVASGSQYAINALINKMKSAQDDNTKYLILTCLKEIDSNHPETIKAGRELVVSRDLDETPIVSTFSLFMRTVDSRYDNSESAVHNEISRGTLQLCAGALNPALSTFFKVLELDPGNIYNRLQIVKVYRKIKRNMEALAMAYFTLSLCEGKDSKVSSQLYNTIGVIFYEEFKAKGCTLDAVQALSNYQKSLDVSPYHDIIPMWNKVEIMLLLWRNADELTKEEREKYRFAAICELQEMKRTCFLMEEHCRRYLPKVVEDMEKALANNDLEPWWQIQLDELRSLAVQIE